MPNTKSAKKRLRQNVTRNEQNRAARSTLRTQIRKVREAVSSGDMQLADSEFRKVARSLDRAGARRLIHRNTAARTKSRLSALVKKAKQPA